ncbi:MAG: Chaperone SurA precursor [Pseudomonadota bacterium]|jgi:peptidyl-prolyl cis-trans isomerase SurA
MNKWRFCTRTVLATCAVGLSFLGGFTPAAAQAPKAIVQADFIVAVVNSEPITNNEVQALRQRLERDAAAQGTARPNLQELQQQALEQLINEKAQLQLALDTGIKVDDEAVDQAEMNVASSNQVSREELRKRLEQEGLTVSLFRAQLRDQLILARLREREMETRIKVSEQEIAQFLAEKNSGARVQSVPEINLAMILIAVPENSSDDKLQALQQRAEDVASRARRGEPFAELAKTYSETIDRGARGGEMGLRSAERYPELFVQAIERLRVNDIAGPLRSGAGFHVLKVLERRDPPPVGLSVTQTRSRHILLRPSAGMSPEQAVARLSELRQQILAGRVSFARAAQELSQDGSASKGGDLGWVGPGQFVPEFEQVMNRLNLNQVSEPLVSRFGAHLIEVLERRSTALSPSEQREMARAALREKKMDAAYARWVEDTRGSAYVELREAPLLNAAPAR